MQTYNNKNQLKIIFLLQSAFVVLSIFSVEKENCILNKLFSAFWRCWISETKYLKYSKVTYVFLF